MCSHITCRRCLCSLSLNVRYTDSAAVSRYRGVLVSVVSEHRVAPGLRQVEICPERCSTFGMHDEPLVVYR
jgi:hypothetical protein